MPSEELQRKIEDAQVEGWELAEEQGQDRAVMIKRKTGSLAAHLVIFVLTFWTFGVVNGLYLGYKYFADVDKKVLRTEDV